MKTKAETDPKSLTVIKLREILKDHKIKIPVNARKQQLINLYNTHIIMILECRGIQRSG